MAPIVELAVVKSYAKTTMIISQHFLMESIRSRLAHLGTPCKVCPTQPEVI